MSDEKAVVTDAPPAFDYFRAFVTFPDGTQHRIRSIYFGNAGSPYRITTAPAKQWGPFYEIEGDDLRDVQVSIVGASFPPARLPHHRE